jgi:hypothetical protein
VDSATVTALATGLLVIVGVAQAGVLIAQRRQHRLELVEAYRRRWIEARRAWAAIVYLGRDFGEFYQIADAAHQAELRSATGRANLHAPTPWALDAVRDVSGTLSDVCLRILQGQLTVGDAYPILGTEFLRHSRPLRALLDVEYVTRFGLVNPGEEEIANWHLRVQREVQDWLIYHDGIRRRCLILIDLLWAEAARLEDLPPPDLRSAATAKERSGGPSRTRLARECVRLRGLAGVPRAMGLSRFLRHAEYRRRGRRIGIERRRLDQLEAQWTARLLHGRQ